MASESLDVTPVLQGDSMDDSDDLPAAVIAEHGRPTTRGDCAGGPRPCPWVGCRHHLYLEVSAAGTVRIALPDKEPWELEHSCALDLADQGELTLEGIAATLGVTRERVRQIENKGLRLMATARRRLT